MKPTWKDVLDCKLHIGYRPNFAEHARKLKYPYFIWNGRVYDTYTDEETGWFLRGDNTEFEFKKD